MGTHRLFNCILVLSLLLSLAGCSDVPAADSSGSSQSQDPSASSSASTVEPAQKGPFTLGFYPDHSIHPALTDNRSNLVLAPLLYEGLFTLDAKFQPVPVLCQNFVVSENGLTWNFALRPGVTFSDGTPLTAELAAQSLREALAPGSRFSGRLREVKSISGKGDTLTIVLSQPNGALPALLNIPLALGTGPRPLGTGPYKFVEGTSSLALRTDWWQDHTPVLPEISLFSIQQAGDLIAAFDSGGVTLLDTDLTGTNSLGYSGSYQVWDYNTTDFLFLGCNTAHGFCQDPAARRAIGRAFERESVASIPFARHAVAAPLPVHPDSPLCDDQLARQVEHTPKLLADFLVGHRTPAHPLTLLVNSENSDKVSAAEYIAYQLEDAGLPIQIRKLPWDDYLAALAGGKFDLYLGEVLLTADFDLTPLIGSAGPLNYSRWADPQTDALLAALRAAPASAREQAARNLCTWLDQQAPILPVCFKHGSVLTQWGQLTGLTPTQDNIFTGLIP